MNKFIKLYIDHFKKVWPILLFLGVALSLLMSCQDNTNRRDSGYSIQGSSIYIIEIDGCEYLYKPSSSDFTHKGNCKNTIHQCQCSCCSAEEEETSDEAVGQLVTTSKVKCCKKK